MRCNRKTATAPTIVVAANPKLVLQLFINVVCYGKEQNNALDREKQCRWQPILTSNSGYVAGDTLLLPESALSNRELFQRSDLIILNDYNHPDKPRSGIPLHDEVAGSGVSLIQFGHRLVNHEIFQFRRDANGMEIHLAYSQYDNHIGSPRRADYQVGHLSVEMPVRVTINGKLDFSMSGRRARTYVVRDYYFVLLGEFRKFGFYPKDELLTMKPLPLTARHTDLQTILY